MVKRRTEMQEARSKRKRGKKPKGLSRYAEKGRPHDYSGLNSNSRPAPFYANKKGRFPSPSEPSGPNDTVKRITATISGIYLRRGFVLLVNEHYDKIYLSDGALTSYDQDIRVTEGDVVECDIVVEPRGPRVRNIIKIKQTA
jgi:hypothetical protein